MSGFLIPVREYSPPTLASVQFALELHKRTGSRLHFLFIHSDGDTVPESWPPQTSTSPARHNEQSIKELIARQARDAGDLLEMHERSGDYLDEVCDVALHKHVDEIIVAVPDPDDPLHAAISQEISMLMRRTHCRVLTIHPKKGS